MLNSAMFTGESKVEICVKGTLRNYGSFVKRESSAARDVLRVLEAEAIEVIRECAASFKNPVLMYSIGKDSSVLLHLARKAFYPGRVPFPMLHIDTKWKFKEMISFRDAIASEFNLELIVHTNEDGVKEGISPFTRSASEYTRIMKTIALRQALDLFKFDAAIGGSRRDEERSRAKERIFSPRGLGHTWNPRNQRPELWRSYNTRIASGQTMRIFPLSNWTEIDIWRYIASESIAINPLYFAKERPTVLRSNQIIVVDDDRFPLEADEVPQLRNVRFRTLGCYPLTAASESSATDLDSILGEIEVVKLSERATRLIDGDNEDSMERKKAEGYF